jgi:hypothetical protein
MKKKKTFLSLKYLILFVLIPTVLGASVYVAASLNYVPEERVEGNKAVTIYPSVLQGGESAQVVIPEVVTGNEGSEFNPFIPGIFDDEPFIDMDSSRDFSTQYNYEGAVLTSKNGDCTVENGVYTATTGSSIYANMDASAPFPYGTISADIMNNGSDSGIVFGLSANSNTFWEGAGVSYYFAFVSFEGVLFLGRTVNGAWSSITYTDITGFDASATYNLKVLYRVDKIVIFLDGVPMLQFRTDEPLTGTGWGIRTGIAGAKISNLQISKKVTID